ncbi:Cyclic nucleotide-binding protein [Pseudocohnilembus persalinus]|uniref:Cyclic nucleotide-binding protein n=1 Tax=Pseudocohnilembus persalinus TaxID=266149 RepID=A0A0V0Q7M7_PSEPJ|nr:Cyclic nucleotide-binding protein [Pseudocohnilembus persalinus]|eukprot:KRW98248.1 Cyclic nucleotide-binding protein [Pseudocohnilembus persalinus]
MNRNQLDIEDKKISWWGKLPVIDPDNKFLVMWQTLQAIVILVFFFIIPLEICVWNEMNEYLFQKGEWGLPYLLGIWFAIGNMVTLGTPIDPQNPYEVFVDMVSAIISIILYGFVISFIMNIVGENQASSKLKKDYKLAMDQYMNEKKIEKSLQAKISDYLDFVVDQDKYGIQNEIMDKLNPHLKKQLDIASKGKLFEKVRFITDNFSTEFKEDLIQKIEEISIDQNDLQIQSDDQNLNIILDGKIQVCLNYTTYQTQINQKLPIKVLQEGDYWGNFGIFSNQARDICHKQQLLVYTPINNKYVKVYQLKKSDFLESLKNHPLDYKCHHYLKDYNQYLLEYDGSKYGVQNFNTQIYDQNYDSIKEFQVYKPHNNYTPVNSQSQ